MYSLIIINIYINIVYRYNILHKYIYISIFILLDRVINPFVLIFKILFFFLWGKKYFILKS